MKHLRLISTALAFFVIGAGLTVAACGGDATKATSAPTADTPAAEYRSTLNRILSEHVSLAANATGAAISGRNDEYNAAVAALDGNSVDLADAIGAAYGPTARDAFLAGWRKHIGFFVDYTQGAIAKDEGKKAKAVADLGQYARDIADLLHAANGMDKDAVVSLVSAHAVGFIAVIDAQVAGDQPKAYAAVREAAAHMHAIADPIAEATVRAVPAKFKV